MRLNFELKFMDVYPRGSAPAPPSRPPFIFPPDISNYVGTRLEIGTPLEKHMELQDPFFQAERFFSQMNYEKMKKRLMGPKKSR